MTKRINSVLLIDGSFDATRTNENVIRSSNLVEHIAVAYNAENALNYLKQRLSVGKGLPNIILLDINIAGMGAWKFLEYCRSQFIEAYKHGIYLLSNGTNQHGVIKGSLHPLTHGVINMPMLDWEIEEIFQKQLSPQKKV